MSGIPEPTDADFRHFRALIEEHSGIHLNPTKKALLHGRLSRRIRQLGLGTFREYYDRVRTADSEVAELIDCVTTNETHFFREPHHFEYIEGTLVPAWIADAKSGGRAKAVRVWSAGCSTGEEPYSIAMVLAAQLVAEPDWTIEVIGTDISRRVLSIAREATWSMERAREIPQPYLKRFMLQGVGEQSGKIRASANLRRHVRVDWMNLNESDPPGGLFDLIFCRNVLIYFDLERKQQIVQRLFHKLAPGGRLFLGHAEGAHWARQARCVAPTVYAIGSRTERR